MSALVAEVVRDALATAAQELLRCDAVLRLDRGSDAVHAARVAVRRMRSDLRSFEPFLEEGWAAALREEMRWLADALGAARDADVLVSRLGFDVEELPLADRTPAYLALAPFRAARDEAYERIGVVLHEARYAELLARIVAAGRHPVLGARAGEPARAALDEVMRESWKRLRRAVRRRSRPAADAELHAIRIRAKRVRYAAESAAAFCGEAAWRFARRVERLQTVLGEQHDAVVAEAALREQVDRAHALFAGELIVVEAARAAAAARRWRRVWKRACVPRLRFWRKGAASSSE
ncbi:MAG: CHAD domain-containing protein [Vulcanimicrobiaceae bacterium]